MRRPDFRHIFQGAFDRQTSMKATSALFSIALLTSSTLVFNLDENIQVCHCWTISVEYNWWVGEAYFILGRRMTCSTYSSSPTTAGWWLRSRAASMDRSSSSWFETGSSRMRSSLELREGQNCSGDESILKKIWFGKQRTLKGGDGGDGGLAGGGVEVEERP